MPLTRSQIDNALPCLVRPLSKYIDIQHNVRCVDVSKDAAFQKLFNGFYRVRRNADWRQQFYSVFESAKREQCSFENMLSRVSITKVEASFASKLVATLDPTQPVIDSIVLRLLAPQLDVTRPGKRDQQSAVLLHAALSNWTRRYLGTESGRYLVSQFKKVHPGCNVTSEKMIDLVLWQHGRNC